MHKKNKFVAVMRYLPRAVPFLTITVLASAAITVFDSLIPQIVRMTVDSVIGDVEPDVPASIMYFVDLFGGIDGLRRNMIVLAVGIVLVSLASALMKYISRTAGARGSEIYTMELRNALFSHIQKLPYSWHIENQTGDIIQRCTSDVNTVKTFISGELPTVFRLIFLIIFSAVMMFAMNYKITLLAVAFVPFIFMYSMLFHSRIHKEFSKADEAEGELSTIAQENISGVRVVRAFGREAYERDKFERQNNVYAKSSIALAKTMGIFWGVSDLFSGVQTLSVIVFGIFAASWGELTAGEFIAFISYNQMLSWPVRQLGRMISQMSRAGVSAGRIAYILSSEVERDEPDEVDMPDGDIVFDNVTFSYGKDLPPVLKNVSFTIKRGETFAILGGCGSGKTTLVLLLHRLYELPDGAGRITIGGVDIKNIKRSSLREKIGMILQEPFLFSKTIGENIAITESEGFSGDAVAKVSHAAEAANIDREINSFAQKYDTVVGERGVTLSGGQKQRVAIARQLIRGSEYIVLDDSLSAVDTETDEKIRNAISKESAGSTVIIISHRVTTLSQADTILVLDGGEVSECGSPEYLAGTGGIYSQIYKLQEYMPENELDEEGKAMTV